MMGQHKNMQIRLRDGRQLGYAQYGAPEGTPLLYMHGFPGCRLDWLLADPDDIAASLDACIIAVDRPGMGLSDFQPGRTLRHWPDDVCELADALQLDRFSVLGISGGGPFAAVCALALPHRLAGVGIVGGMGPAVLPGMTRGTSWTLPGKPALIRRFLLMMMSLGLNRDPDQFIGRSLAAFAPVDRPLLRQRDYAKLFAAAQREAFRNGIRGAAHEAALLARPWGFALKDIDARVYLWHGEQDANVPVSVGRAVAAAIPRCRAAFFEAEGHLSLPHNHLAQVLTTLLS